MPGDSRREVFHSRGGPLRRAGGEPLLTRGKLHPVPRCAIMANSCAGRAVRRNKEQGGFLCRQHCARGGDVTVDLVKACAILGVAVIHAATGAYQNQLGSAGWYSAVAWGSVSRASVPLFLMCTGVLFLAPEKELSGKKLWLRYILRIAVAMFFWALVYKFYHLAVSWNFTAESITGAVKEVLFFQHEDHLYYLHMVLLIYAFLPLLRLLTCHGDKRLLQYALGLWFALGIVYPTVQSYWPFTLLAGVPLQWMLNMSYAAMGYCLLGYYLKKYPLRRRWGALSLGLGLACVFGGRCSPPSGTAP